MALTQPARVEPCALGLRGWAVGSALVVNRFLIFITYRTANRFTPEKYQA
jgi:hypothetical protein